LTPSNRLRGTGPQVSGRDPTRGQARIFPKLAAALFATTVSATALVAQEAAPPPRSPSVVELSGGWAGFGDDGVIHHSLFGAGARLYLSRRFSLGPELVYMVGPGQDRDLMLTGNVWVDLLAPTPAKPRRTTPFLVVGGGWFHHSDGFAGATFSSSEGGFTAGVGIRGWVSERVSLGVDARLGWEPHLRVAGTLGVALGR
jgi:hypothetical protein